MATSSTRDTGIQPTEEGEPQLEEEEPKEMKNLSPDILLDIFTMAHESALARRDFLFSQNPNHRMLEDLKQQREAAKQRMYDYRNAPRGIYYIVAKAKHENLLKDITAREKNFKKEFRGIELTYQFYYRSMEKVRHGVSIFN